MKTYIPVQIVIGCLIAAAVAADDPIDMAKLRRIHQKAQSGEQLTPEEQAYYERGKAARKTGKQSPPPAKKSKSAEAKAGKTSTGLVPLSDLTAEQSYRGQDGGLYGNGQNQAPASHRQAALAAAAKIQPLDADGRPVANGRIVMLTHGMSNTTQESQAFMAAAKQEARVNPALLIVDGAQGGIDSRQWVSDRPGRSGVNPWDRLDQRIQAAGATNQQVQVVWMKHAMARVAQYGDFPEHAERLKNDLAQISRMLKARFPNLQLAFVSSRTYAGYATTELNPEPYAYESAFAVRWLIQEQIKGSEQLSHADGKAPVLLWGPYLWADGERGRAAGDLSYSRDDYRDDGTHPSPAGQQKIAHVILNFFLKDPAAKGWFEKKSP
jgi:hypothetical protein